MKRSLAVPLISILTLVPAIPAKANDPLRSEITVRVYNFAGAPAPELARAQKEAAGIFARVDIHLRWLNCTLGADGQPTDPTCHNAMGPAVLNLRLAPPEMEPKNGLPWGIFGFSLIGPKGEFSTTANLYLERVSAIADGRKYRGGVVLGAMIAHELGHLLLGVGSHSKMGLMTLPWGPEVLTAADQGTLGFTAGETRQLRKSVNERARASYSSQRSFVRVETKLDSPTAR